MSSDSHSLKSHPPLAAVVAVARNGVIGRAGALPWQMPGDLARFRALTMGKPMIMGRRTFDSIGRALPGRESIVVTRRPLAPAQAVFPASSPEAALALAKVRAAAMGAGEISLIGGAALFDALLPRTTRLYLTEVDLEPAGDTFFPAVDPAEWREIERVRPARHPGDEAPCVFLTLERRLLPSDAVL